MMPRYTPPPAKPLPCVEHTLAEVRVIVWRQIVNETSGGANPARFVNFNRMCQAFHYGALAADPRS